MIRLENYIYHRWYGNCNLYLYWTGTKSVLNYRPILLNDIYKVENAVKILSNDNTK